MRLDESIEWISPDGMRLCAAVVGTPVHLVDVRGIDGLEQEIYTVKGTGQAGVSVQGTSLAEREIEVDLSIARNGVPHRAALLRAFRPCGEPGTFVFRRGADAWHISAYVQQAPRFTAELLTPSTLVLLCPAPAMLKGDADVSSTVDIAAWLDDIEFAFEIPEEGHELSHRAPQLIVNAVNEGDMASGCVIEFRASGSCADPVLINAVTQERLSLRIDLVAGDVLTVNTYYGSKRVMLLRDGVQHNVFNALETGSTWLQMAPGDNFLRYDAGSNVENLDCTIRFNAAFSGV